MADADFTRLVSEAFRNYASLLSLARSPLAHTSLVTPALVLDPLAPTPDERGRALRVLLRWAVMRLVPAPPRYPMGAWRPYTDDTWRDPLWWGYNLLRHRYLDPLPPDAREEGFTDALLELTGIPDAQGYYKARTQAVEEVARFLREQLAYHAFDDDLRRLALEGLFRALRTYQPAAQLMGVAATFRGEFSRRLLLDLAQAEGLPDVAAALTYLLGQRLLQQGDGGTHLWISSPVQAYVHAQQPHSKRVRRHRRVANAYRAQGPPLRLAWHLRMAGDVESAARVLLEHAEALVGELQTPDLHAELAALEARQLPAGMWFRVQCLLWDLCRKLGDREGALLACRRALKAADGPTQQAQVYRRYGKLYEDYNQQQALAYYQMAVERFAPDDPELVDVLKDRAWVRMHLQGWEEAEADLCRALALGQAQDVSATWRVQADIHNAFASLYRQQGDTARALEHAQTALSLRSEGGDPQRVAESWSNVALIYTEMGKTSAALAAYHESQATFEKLGNREAVAIVELNVGMALQLAGRLSEAIERYTGCLRTFEAIGVPLSQSQACFNLTESYLALGDEATARRYWRTGYRLGQEAGLEGELDWYRRLAREHPVLAPASTAATSPPPEPDRVPASPPEDAGDAGLPQDGEPLLAEEARALEIARAEGKVTPRRLMAVTGVSKATATRRLSGLMDRELLQRRGKGRGTHYVLR